MWKYYNPVEVVFGTGKLDELGQLMAERGLDRALIVSDPFTHRSGVAARLNECAGGRVLDIISEVEPNPTCDNVDACARRARELGARAIIGLGGGSIVRVKDDGSVTVGPDSVGYEITKKALVFGGDTMTATDIAVRLGMVELGDKSKVADIPQETADKAMAVIRALVEDSVDAMKVSNADVDLILVGGGSIILPETISGAASVLKPEHFGCANAIGSAISKVSGTYEKLMNYDELPREQSLEKAKHEAIELAVAAGAVRETVEIIEMEDVPLAYYPGNTNRVKIKAAGDLS